MIHTPSPTISSHSAESPEIRFSDAEMVEKFWRFLPPHIRNALDAIEQQNAQKLEKNLAQITAGISARHDEIDEAMRDVLVDVKKIGAQAAKNTINFRARVLRGETRPLEFMRAESYGIDLIADLETVEGIGHVYAVQRKNLEMTPVGPKNAMKVRLPKGRFFVDLGHVQIFDEELGITPFIAVPHNEIIAIHGHEPQDHSRLPAFFQNPNFFPNGTPKGGEHRPTFFTVGPLIAPHTPATP